MAAYIVFCVTTVGDEDRYAEYQRRVMPLLKATPGLKVSAGPTPVTLEGSPLKVAVVLEFGDVEAARTWYYSDEYQSVAAIRHESTEGFAFIVE